MPVLIEEVRACVAAVVGSAQVAQLAADAPLVETGLVSSMELVAVAAAIEQQFGIAVPAAAVTVANFNTLAALARMIERLRLGARVAAAPADTVDRPVLQSLAACLRRPIWLAFLIAAFSVSLDFTLGKIMRGSLAGRYAQFLEFGHRLYPVSGGYSTDDLGFAVAQHHILRATGGEPRVAVFGDSGTIGSWVHYHEAIPAVVQATLRPRFPRVEVYNLAHYMQSLTKDVTILEATLQGSQGKFPFDVAVFTLGDQYFNHAFMDMLLGRVPFLSLNKELFLSYTRRLPPQLQRDWDSLYDALARADAKQRSAVGSWLQRKSAMYHYAPFFRYFVNELPFFKLTNPNYNFHGQFALGNRPLFPEPLHEPPAKIPADTGIPNSEFDQRLYNLLDATIGLLERNDIPIVLFLKPEAPREWRRFFQKVGDRDARNVAEDMCRDRRCVIADARWALTGQQFTDSLAHYTPEANALVGNVLADAVLSVLEDR